MTPPEVLAYRQNGGAPNGPGWDLRVVPNKFPALQVEGDARSRGRGDVRPDERHRRARGDHRDAGSRRDAGVRCRETEIERVLWAFRERMLDLKQDARFRYILVFKNHGAAAGATLEHPHSQLIALPIVPDFVREEIDGARRHFAAKERCVFCDIVRQELPAGGASSRRTPTSSRSRRTRRGFRSRRGCCRGVTASRFEEAPRHEYESLARLLKAVLHADEPRARDAAVQPGASTARRSREATCRVLPLARRDHAEADAGGRLRVGHRVLHQPDVARGSGAGAARGEDLIGRTVGRLFGQG